MAVDAPAAPSATAPGRPSLPVALAVVAAAAALPGLGHLLLGRRRAGAGILAAVLVGVGGLLVAVGRLGRSGLLQALVSTRALFGFAAACVLAALLATAVVVWTYVLTRPRGRRAGHQVVGATVVATLCAALALPLGVAAKLADTQRRLLDAVFAAAPRTPAAAPGTPTAPEPAALRQPRLNVLLLGSDAGPDRTGARTDTMILASVDTRTAATTLFALPRNIQHAPFPPGSPMAARFPDGFHDPRAPASGDYLLNNVAEYGRAHPELAPAGPTDDRGLNLLMSTVSYMLDLPVDYYVEVGMDGLAAVIDALGGVTVDVGPVPLPIGGVTYDGRRVAPDGYLPAGVHHLDGHQALWYARSRRNSDDYDRMARQRCLINAVLTQKSPADVLTHFRSVAAATADSVTTDIPQSLLPALLTLADEQPPRLRAVSFDPDLPDPDAADGRFDPARPDVAFMRRVVGNALFRRPATPVDRPAPRPGAAPTAPPAPAPVAPACTTSP
jgi:LCP family protein required for cell wall assembly